MFEESSLFGRSSAGPVPSAGLPEKAETRTTIKAIRLPSGCPEGTTLFWSFKRQSGVKACRARDRRSRSGSPFFNPNGHALPHPEKTFGNT